MKTDRERRGWLVGLVIVFVALAYAAPAPKEFVFDDREAVQENLVVNGELPWTAAFTHDFWGHDAANTVGSYRPVPVLLWRAVYATGGGRTWAFRAMSLGLHCAVLISAGIAFESIGPITTIVAVGLLAVCTATSEAVLCIVGSADLLCALFVLLGLMAHRRGGVAGGLGAALCFLLAVGSKETGAMAPVVWLVFDWFLPPEAKVRDRLPRFGLYAALMVPYLIGRQHALGALLPKADASLRNPLVTLDFFHRMLSAADIFLTKYVVGLLVPWRRMFDCSANACGGASLSDPVAWAGLALGIGLCVLPFGLRRRAPVAAAGIAWFVLFFLPGSNFLVKGPTIYGERLLYLPSIGLFLAVVSAVASLRPAWIAAGLFGAANLMADRQRVSDWSSNLALARSGLQYAADSAIVQVNLAVEERALKDYAAVEAHARRAIAIDPREMPPHRELAAALFATGRLDEARREFELAWSIRQDDVLTFDYANFLGRQQHYARAQEVIRIYLDRNPHHPELVQLQQKLRRAQERAHVETLPTPP